MRLRDEVPILGIDDILQALSARPSPAAVDRPPEKMGRFAAQMRMEPFPKQEMWNRPRTGLPARSA
ncbi:MAG: hypothetical protein JW929_08410 [Anaerolineales bacterium]|nr:hypothetical protein [Anaerolineales bacterium]